MDSSGAVAVVTGGASGIGAAVVERLRAAGSMPVVWDLQPGGIVCDVSDAAAVARAMRETVDRHGVPRIMVTSAGVGSFAPVVAVDAEEWDRVLAVNLRGTMLCVQAAARELQRADASGSIVCISSVNGKLADRGMSAYCCSKAAVDMLARVAAAELGPSGIRVNAIAPGVTDTPLAAGAIGRRTFTDGVVARTPLGTIGHADDVAAAVMAVIAADWITGQVIAADGGLGLHSPIDAFGSTGPGRDRGAAPTER